MAFGKAISVLALSGMVLLGATRDIGSPCDPPGDDDPIVAEVVVEEQIPMARETIWAYVTLDEDTPVYASQHDAQPSTVLKAGCRVALGDVGLGFQRVLYGNEQYGGYIKTEPGAGLALVGEGGTSPYDTEASPHAFTGISSLSDLMDGGN